LERKDTEVQKEKRDAMGPKEKKDARVLLVALALKDAEE